MKRDLCDVDAKEQAATRDARVSVDALITEELRRAGFDSPAGFGVPRRKVKSAVKSVLGELIRKPGGVSPEETQALFRYMFARLGWV